MLLKTYKDNELFSLTNVLGESDTGKEVFRGDLVIELGDMHESSQTRNPPKKVFEQAVLLAEGGKITFFAGYLVDIALLEDLAARFGGDFADDISVIVYCFNIDAPMQVEAGGTTYTVLPMTSGLVWNELLDLLYLEKSDLKGQSPEEKVETMAGAKGELKPKGDVLDIVAAAAKSNGAVREFDGPV
jgi:hypothetical protein